MRYNYLFVFILTIILYACSSESKKETTEKNSDPQDSIEVEIDSKIEEESMDVSNNNEKLVIETDNWIKQIRETDTIKWEGVYTNEYDESSNIDLYMNTSGDFRHASMDLPETEDGMSFISYYFDKNLKLCRMDIIEVRNSFWHDELSNIYYFQDGTPIWLHSTHVYKTDIVADTSYSPGPFTDDSYLIFYTADNLGQHVTKR